MQHGVVTCARSHILIRAQDHALTHEGAQRVVRHGIGHTIVGACPAALRPHEVILAVADEHERPLDITFGRNLLEGLAVVEGDEPAQVVTQLGDIAVAPAAVIHVERAVLVLEYELVDGLRAVDDLADKGLAQIILERPCGVVRHGYAYAADLALMHVVRAEEEIILSILLYGGGGPQRTPQPLYARRVDDTLMLGPLHQILRREGVEEQLIVKWCRIGGIDPIGVAEDHTLWVGIAPLEYGVAAPLLPV